MANRPYQCHKCGVGGVKLWRDYGTPFHWDLWCVDCACAADHDKGIDPASVREDGTRVTETHILPKRLPGQDGLITGVATLTGAVTVEWLNAEYEVREVPTDTLGWYVPAIPVDAATGHDAPDAYWGYTSTDSDDYQWWVARPLHMPVPTLESMGIPPGQASPL